MSAAHLPWVECAMCQQAAGLLVPHEERPLCPDCARQLLLERAARQALCACVAPVLGAWGHYWQRSGLSLSDLSDLIELESGAWTEQCTQLRLQRAALHQAMRAYPTPAYTAAEPLRATFDVESFPLLASQMPGTPSAGLMAHFIDTQGRTHTLSPGLDCLCLHLGGLWTVVYTGFKGETDFTCAGRAGAGLRVPADLWPAVRTVLGGVGEVL